MSQKTQIIPLFTNVQLVEKMYNLLHDFIYSANNKQILCQTNTKQQID